MKTTKRTVNSKFYIQKAKEELNKRLILKHGECGNGWMVNNQQKEVLTGTEHILTLQEAAQYLRVSIPAFLYWVKRDFIKGIKIGKYNLFRRDEILDMLYVRYYNSRTGVYRIREPNVHKTYLWWRELYNTYFNRYIHPRDMPPIVWDD